MLDSSAQRLEQLNRAIDRIHNKYGFTTIQTGRTLLLKDLFPSNEKATPCTHQVCRGRGIKAKPMSLNEIELL